MTPDALALSIALVIAGLAVLSVWLAVSRRRLAHELATARGRFATSMDLAPFCAYLKSPDGRYVYVNHAFMAVMRQDLPHVTSVIGRTDNDIMPAGHAQSYIDDDAAVLRQGTSLAFDNVSVAVDGTVREWLSVKFPWADENGRTCVAGISADLSELRRAQQVARESEDRCALALEAGQMGTISMDLSTQMLETSPLFAVLHGRPETKTRLSLVESLAEVHPDDRRSVMEAVQAAIRDQAPSRIAYRVVRPGGAIAWIELTGKVYPDHEGRPSLVRGVAFDITERQQAYEEVSRHRASLLRLIGLQEDQRQMLCNELHDGMMQYSIGATMLLDAARGAAESVDQAARIAEAIDCLHRGLAEGRQLIRGVRCAVLDDLGLVAAIHDLADQMRTFGIEVTADIDGTIDALPKATALTVYRVVQESLANIRKHAETKQATVAIRRLPLEVHLCVSDAGRGFDVAGSMSHGFGLSSMDERVRLSGGRSVIESQPGAGSRVEVWLPIAEDD